MSLPSGRPRPRGARCSPHRAPHLPFLALLLRADALLAAVAGIGSPIELCFLPKSKELQNGNLIS